MLEIYFCKQHGNYLHPWKYLNKDEKLLKKEKQKNIISNLRKINKLIYRIYFIWQKMFGNQKGKGNGNGNRIA